MGMFSRILNQITGTGRTKAVNININSPHQDSVKVRLCFIPDSHPRHWMRKNVLNYLSKHPVKWIHSSPRHIQSKSQISKRSIWTIFWNIYIWFIFHLLTSCFACHIVIYFIRYLIAGNWYFSRVKDGHWQLSMKLWANGNHAVMKISFEHSKILPSRMVAKHLYLRNQHLWK